MTLYSYCTRTFTFFKIEIFSTILGLVAHFCGTVVQTALGPTTSSLKTLNKSCGLTRVQIPERTKILKNPDLTLYDVHIKLVSKE